MHDSTIRISTVIPTYRAPELAVRVAEGLCPVPRWGELIVVDDGSGDHTAERVHERTPDATVLCLPRNRGFGGATNAGFVAARGRFLVTLNNDALAGWEDIARLADFLEDHPAAAAVAPALEDEQGRRQRVAFTFPRGVWGFLQRRRQARAISDSVPFRTEYTKGACVVFRRSALREVGLFDEQFWMFAEELDLFRRLDRAGWETWIDPRVCIFHEGGVTTRNHPDRAQSSRFRQQSYLSICRYYAKHHAWLMALWLRAEMAVRVFGRLLAEAVRLIIGRGDRWWLREHARCLVALGRPVRSEPRERTLSGSAAADASPAEPRLGGAPG